jgi:hypothetical protein
MRQAFLSVVSGSEVTMWPESSDAVRKVLREASDHASFAGWSFAERLVWMIDRGYELGRQEKGLPRAKLVVKDVRSGKEA